MAGGRLSLKPSAPRVDQLGVPKASEEDNLADWYAANPNKIIDLSRSDAKQHWEKLVKGMHNRHVNWMEQIAEVGGEIAKVPAAFIEGIVEEKGNPLTIAASSAEGVVRSVRDLYGMIGESENPTSLLFGFRSAIRAIKSGKISQNWEEEAQQWNETRKFLWDSYKVMNGDMSVYETLPYVNMSEATAQKLRALSNPKIAHAVSFIGLELPSLLTAPFTGGAGVGLAVATAGRQTVMQTAAQAAKASAYARVMGTLTEAGKRLDALAAGAALRATGAVATGVSKAISVPANLVEGVIGKNIDAIAARGGVSSAQARNITAATAINGMAEVGAGEIRQTVGYLGSLGLRTTAELAGEIGEQASLLASGAIPAQAVNGLSVLERVAGNKLLSGSARNAAKFLNVTVDPILQMSTAALKHGYKDAAFFAGLGYMNDRERGAVGGAAMGMVWGGYSGAVRHLWSNINGFVQHERFIKDFDERLLPKLEQGWSPDFAAFARKVVADADTGKSSKTSANARMVLQQMHLMLDAKQKKQVIAGTLPAQEMAKVLAARGVVDPMRYLDPRGKGQFSLVRDTSGNIIPLIWLNPEKYRPADFGHEVLSHMAIWNLQTRGQLGTHLVEFFGIRENEGVISDEKMTEVALRMSLEEALNRKQGMTIEEARQVANEIYNADADTVGSRKYFERAIKEFRSATTFNDFHLTQDINGEQVPNIYLSTRGVKGERQSPIQYIFEEFIGKHAENMFIHTNLQDLILAPEDKPLRMYFERKYTERLARNQTELELAGVVAKYGAPLTKDGRPTIQAMIYDDGVYYRHPAMDNVLKNMLDAARSVNDGPISNLSPEMQLAVAKKHRKEFLFNIRGNGATLKGEKERNEMSANNAKGAFEVIDALPDDLKPKITVDEHGNRSADVYTMKDEVIDAMVDGGFLDPESGRVAKVFRDTYMQYESSGFATGNLVYGINIGDSHRTAVGNLFKRIFGDDVPATNRVFVPFELKVYLRTTDGNGKNLRAPRGGFTATVMDYTAIHRRQIKTWSRADVKALWSNIGEFNADFHEYLLNFLKDPANRVDSATLFRSKFGADAEKVRDIMYETFGASKRKDESYFNAPREGYFSSHENPNFPIHSLKLENLIGVERISAAPFPYHHGRSYEPLRRNLSVAGFEEISANMFGNGQGYRVIRERNSESSGWKVFSPFGGLIGRYKDKDKAFKAAQKHLRKDMDPADVLALPTDEEWSQMNRPERLKRIQEDKLNYHQSRILKARGSLSVDGVREGGIGITLERNGADEFVRKISDPRMRGFGMSVLDFFPETEKGKFRQYAISNGLPERFFDGIRVKEDDMPAGKRKVDFAAFGSPMEVEGNFHDMLPTVTYDRAFFDGLSRQKAEEVFSNLLESHLSKIARSYHDGNILTSTVTKRIDSFSLENRQFLQSVAEGWKLLADARLEGKELPPSYKAAYDAVVAKHEWCEDANEPRWEQIRTSSDDAEIKSLFEGIIGKKYTSQAAVDAVKALDRAFGGNWQKNKPVIEALRQLNLVDKEGVAVPIQNSDGLTVFLSVNKDYSKHVDVFERFMNSYAESQRKEVSHVAKNYFSHALHQEYSDLQYQSRGVDASGMMRAGPNPRQSKGGTQVIPPIGPIAEATRKGTSIISVRLEGVGKDGQSKSPIGTGEGFIFNISVNQKLALRGGAEVVTGWLENRAKRLAPLPPFSALPNVIVDYVTGGRFEKSELPNIARDLSYTIISSVKESDQNVVKVWSEFAKDNNPMTLARGLFDIALDSGNQASLEMALSFRKLAMAADEPTAQARFTAKYGTPENMAKSMYQAELNNASTSYWHEAVADHNTMASSLWDVGGKKTLIEAHYEGGVSSEFHRLFGYNAESLTKRVEASRARQKKFHDAAEQTYKRSFSIGGVDDLSPSRREEVIRSGLAKEIRFGGKNLLVFEFSDADAYLDLSSVQNKPHLLPFAGMPDAEQAFSDYAFEVKRRAADPQSEKYIPFHKQIGRDTTLGKIFGHETMYYYYPEMRDVRVRWYDGHGGSAITLPDGEHLIELGVRTFANSELNMKNDPEGLIFSDPQSATAKHIAQNPLASIVLHEAQHVLQYRANMDSEHGHFNQLNREVTIGHFANLLGLRTNFADGEVIGKAMKNNSVWSDADITATKDINVLASRIALAKDSPVFRELSGNARPLLKTAVRNLSAFVAAEVDAGRMDESFSRRMLALDRAQDGVQSIHDAMATYKEMMAVREELRSKYPSYSANMHFDTDFRAAISALGLVRSVVAIEKATPQQRKLLIRQAFDEFIDLDYIMTPVERMARETESRRMLSQDELAKSPRTYTTDALPQGSVLGIIQRAMDSSTVETTKGLMEKQTASFDAFDKGYVSPIRTVMMSIGGIGESKDYADNTAFTLLGKMSLARFFLSKATTEYTNIRRFFIQQKGWEVVDGKMTLVTGNYVVSGDFDSAVKSLAAKFRPDSVETGDRTAYAVSGVTKESGTYTIADIAEIAGIKIESEDILSLGNSVMDKVASDDFPPVFSVKEIKGLLGDYSQESAAIVLLDYVVERMNPDRVLTKNDLLNIMAFNHSDMEMLYNVSEANVGINKARPVAGRPITKEMKMKVLRLYPAAARSKIVRILEASHEGNHSRPFYGRAKQYKYGRFKVSGGQITFEAPHFNDALAAGIPPADVAAFRERLSKGVSQRIVQHSVSMTKNEAYDIASQMNDRMVRLSVLMEPVMEKAYEFVVQQNTQSPERARVLWLSMMEDVEIAALRIAFSDQYSGQKTNTTDIYTRVGGMDGTVNATEQAARGLQRVFGETSPAAKLRESGGMNQRGRSNSLPISGLMPSLHMLHGNFLFGSVPAEGFARVESGVTVAPAQAMHHKERRYLGIVSESNQSNQDTGGGLPDYLTGAQHALTEQFKYVHGNWSDGDMGGIMGRMRGYVEAVSKRAENTADMKERLLRIQTGLRMNESRNSIISSEWQGEQVLKRVDALMAEGMSQDEAFASLLNELDRRIEMAKADEADLAEVLTMQLDSVSAFAANHGAVMVDKNGMPRARGGDEAPIEVMTPHRFVMNSSVQAAGTSAIQIRDKTFVDVDLSLAEPDQPTSVVVPAIGVEQGMPSAVQKQMNMTAHAVEGVITGLIGSAVKRDEQMVLSPLRQNPLMLGYLERLNPENQVAQGLDGEMTSNAYTVIGGLMYASHNTFLSYHDMMTAGNRDLIRFATDNLRDQINTDYQTGGIFSNPAMTRNAFLSGRSLNYGVLGMMIAPYVLAHDSLGFPVTSGENILHRSRGIRTEKFLELVEMAKETDMRDQTQAAAFNSKLTEWIGGMDAGYLQRLLYECSSASVIDGVLLRMNMLQMHVLASEHPTRADRLNKANEMGAIHGFDDYFGDSQLYTSDGLKGRHPEANRYMHARIKESSLNPDMWRGVFFGLAAAKEIETRRPSLHPYVGHGKVRNRSKAYMQGEETLVYGRPMPSYRRSTSDGLDVDSFPVDRYDTESGFGGAFGTTGKRKKISETDIFGLVAGNESTRVHVQSEDPVSLFDAIGHHVDAVRQAMPVDVEGTSSGVKDSWYTTDVSGSVLIPYTVGTGEKTSSVTVQTRKHPLGVVSRRKLLVNRLAAAAEQLGSAEVSVQPARFTSSKRVQATFKGISNKDRRAEMFYEQDVVPIAFSGQSFVSARYSERDRPSLGFAWKRLEDGRIMLNIAPDTNVGGYLDLSNGTEYNTPLGFSHRRTLGWDVESGVLTPMSPLSIIRRFASTKDNNPIASRSASHMDFIDPMVRAQYEASAKAIAQRVYGGANIKSMSKQQLSKYGNKPDAIFDAYQRIMSGDRVMDFDDFTNEDAKVARVLAMAEFSSMASPEDGYVTVILPANATMADIQHAFFTQVAHSNLLLTSDRYGVNQKNGAYRRGGSSLPADGSPHLNGYATTNEIASVKSAIDNYLAIRIDNRAAARAKPSDFGYADTGAQKSTSTTTQSIQISAQRYGLLMPSVFADLGKLHERMTSSEGGYFMPDVERSIALNGDRSAVIDLIMPNSPHLQRYAWDAQNKANVSIIRKSDKSGYLVGHDVVSGVDRAGNPIKTRKVSAFRTESEAKAHADRVSQGGIEAEIPSILFREGQFRLEDIDPSLAHSRTSGKADINAGLKFHPEFVSDKAETYDGGDKDIFTTDGTYFVGNIDKTFASRAEAKAAQEMLLRTEAITGKAPSRDRINLSVGDVGVYEHDIRRGLQFAVGGSYIQFAPKALSILRTAMVPMMEKNKHGATKKVKKAVDIATGSEWYEMFMENQVSKAEMRVLGLAEFLYDHKEHKITKQEVAKFIWAMYPTTGRLNHERLQTPYVGNVTSPTVAIRSAAHRLLAERNRHLKTIEAAIESAPEDQKGEMVAYLANIRKMHDDALKAALEQFYEKDRAEKIASRPDLLENASDISKDALPKRQIADMMLQEFRNFDAITEPVMATYRHLFNDAFARARLEASARLSGFDLAIADFRTSDTSLNEISNWGLAMNTSYHGSRIEPPPSRSVSGKGVQNQTTQADASAYGLQHIDTVPDYVGYTSGIGSYRWDTLYTDLEIQKGENYVRSLKDMANLESDPAKKEALLRQHKSAERIMSVRKSAKGATRNSGHKNTPTGTMQLGHARHSDVIVTAYHRANAPIGEVASSLRLNRDTLAVLGVEELQSDPYQGSTFGPKQDAMLGATFEQVEATSLVSEFKMVTDKIAEKENARANISAPLNYITHSSKQKHRDALYNFVARYEWDNGTPLFRYLIARDYLSQNNDTSVTFNHEVRHKISKQVQEQYGMKEDYVPEVVFDLNYDGGLHMRLYEMIHEDMNGNMSPMESDLYSLLYGYGNSEHAGLVGTSTRAMFRYSSNTNPHSLAMLIATVGLQFNKEFMAKVDELGQFYELELDHAERPPVDYDKVAMETLMDFRRRVERADPDQLPNGHSMRGNHMLFKQWKTTTLRALRYLELAYYEEGSQIVEYKNRRTAPHINRGEYHTADTPEVMSSKMPVILSAARINDYVSSAESYSGGKVKPRQAAENAKKILSRIQSGMGHRFLELRPAHQVALDLRLRAQILGMEPLALVDHLDRSNYPDGGWPSGSVVKEKADTMRLALTEPDKVTADQLELLDEAGHKLIRVTDVDLDPTSGSALSRSRVSQPAYARTLLGRIFENNAPAIINTYLGHTPDPELDVLKARHNELKAKLGDSIAGDYDYPDTIPLGEDNAYRGVMTNWYAMRALQSRKDALVVMDARHHRARYSSNSNFVTLFNLGGGIIAPIPTGGMKRRTVLAAGYVLHEAKKQKTHGGFIEALHAGQFPDAFLANQASMEWNGVNNNFKTHMRLAASEIVAQMPELTRDSNASLINAVDTIMDLVLVGDNRYGSDEINNLNKLITSVRAGRMTKERAILAIEGMTDGKDIAKRIFTHFEKPQGVIMNVPIGRTHGYASNYGAPLWHNKLYYSGMQEALINQVSHDAFDIPDVSMRDGKYVVTDKKTGKVIVEGITSFDEAQERAAQSAKYLGAVPIVSNFLKTFGKMGGYAMEGFMMATNKNESQTSQVLKDTMKPDLIAPYTEMSKTAGMAGAAGMTQRMGSSFGNFPMPDANTMPVEGTSGVNRIEARHGVFGPDMSEDPVNTALEHATALHAMGVRAGADAEQIAAGLHRLGGFTGPMLVIRPKFPTANHMAEAKKAIIQGIPFMSVSGVDKPEVMAKEATGMMKFWAGKNPELLKSLIEEINAYQPKRGPLTKEEMKRAIVDSLTSDSKEDVAKKHGVTTKGMFHTMSVMRKSGIDIPPMAPSSNRYLSTESTAFNPKTRQYEYTQEVRDSVRLMASRGVPIRENAAHHGIGYGTVRRILNEPQKARDYRPERTDPTEPYGGPHA